MKNDSLGNRMKEYENKYRLYLERKIPVVIRIDGKAFHTFTKGMQKPFDRILMTAMQHTMKYLCKNIQGCVFGYTQSDEITLVLTDYATITTDAWFGYNIQKVTSVSASMATQAFNKYYRKACVRYLRTLDPNCEDIYRLIPFYESKFGAATFDSRVFSIPKDEVCNCLIWRQKDAMRNSIESVGQANFSQKQLYCKTCKDIQEMLVREKGINWNDFPTDCKRGSSCYKVATETTIDNPNPNESGTITVIRNHWVVDKDIPVFTQNRNFIERWL